MYEFEGLTWAEVEMVVGATEHLQPLTRSCQSQPFTTQAQAQLEAQVFESQVEPWDEPLIYRHKRAQSNGPWLEVRTIFYFEFEQPNIVFHNRLVFFISIISI